MKLKIAGAVLVLALLLTFATSCIQVSGVVPQAELAITQHQLLRDATGNATGVFVTIKNISSFTAELAEVQVKFYDVQKNLIDAATDSVLNLKPNETWAFTIPCSGGRCREIASYQVDITYGSSVGGF